MKTGATAGEKEIQTTGFFVFGALTLIVALLKLAVFSDWSWWRVSLPILIFVGFNIAYIVTGFGYLSFAEARERSLAGRTARHRARQGETQAVCREAAGRVPQGTRPRIGRYPPWRRQYRQTDNESGTHSRKRSRHGLRDSI